jgi:DNA-binding Xre family transcriptional regulator
LTSQASETEQQGTTSHRLNALSRAEQQARISEARHRLLKDVIGFLRKMKNGGESSLGRNPSSEDLLPYFETYAWCIIETRDGGQIVSASSMSEVRRMIRASLDRAVELICRRGEFEGGEIKGGGVWWLTTDRACKAVDLGAWTTAYGTYTKAAFLHPKRMQLRALLLIRAQELVTKFWDRNTEEGQNAAPINHTNQTPEQASGAIVTFLKRAQWLKDCMKERGWSADDLASKSGITSKTVRRVLKGSGSHASTLESIAKGLSKAHSQVAVATVPDC